MNFFYNIAVSISNASLPIAGIFNSKIKLFVNGRKNVFKILKNNISDNDEIIWFHCASLGEFEQGRPVIEKLKTKNPTLKILVTFFSPSGYEVQRNYTFADIICYLPVDTKSNAKKFIEIVKPKIAVFVKYEFWPNFLNELKQKKIDTILISGIFRKNQSFFKGYGRWMRKSLKAFSHFFLQNETSKALLEGIGFNNITVSGDTRLDRVYDILNQENKIKEIQEFKNDTELLVAGSTWKEGEKLLIEYINNYASNNEKFIIAPHNINAIEIERLKSFFEKETVLFSDKSSITNKTQVLIIDSIGLLTKIYSYADIAYVGGAFNTGLHNVSEPATFGVPILIGPEFQKFNEAVELVQKGACTVIHNQQEFNKMVKELFENKNLRNQKGKVASSYVKDNKGATDLILNYLNKAL